MESRLNELIFLRSSIEPKAVTSSSSSPTGALSKGRQSMEDPPLHFGSSISVSMTSTSSSAVTTQQLETMSLDSPSGREEEIDSPEGTFVSAKETTNINQDGTIRVPSGSGFRIMTPFPWRLHEILEEVEKEKLEWIVSWLPNGRGFKIHCQKSFSEIIIPRFFRSSRYKSFQRQLYLYGFRSMETHNMSRGRYNNSNGALHGDCFRRSLLTFSIFHPCRGIFSPQICQKRSVYVPRHCSCQDGNVPTCQKGRQGETTHSSKVPTTAASIAGLYEPRGSKEWNCPSFAPKGLVTPPATTTNATNLSE